MGKAITRIYPDEICDAWPECEPYLRQTLTEIGTPQLCGRLLKDIADGNVLLWAIVSAHSAEISDAFLTGIEPMPEGRRAMVCAREATLRDWPSFIEEALMVTARGGQCDRVGLFGSPALRDAYPRFHQAASCPGGRVIFEASAENRSTHA